mgnify:CR=1 FL=1
MLWYLQALGHQLALGRIHEEAAWVSAISSQ